VCAGIHSIGFHSNVVVLNHLCLFSLSFTQTHHNCRAFGAKGWTKLFKKQYHRGQLSITFVSSMFPAGVLLVHHLMAVSGTKRHISDKHLWRHSITNVATDEFNQLRRTVSNQAEMIGWMKDYVGGGYSMKSMTSESSMYSKSIASTDAA